jgi:hypothetical protein
MLSARPSTRRGLIAVALAAVSAGVYAAVRDRRQPVGASGGRTSGRPGPSPPVSSAPTDTPPSTDPTTPTPPSLPELPRGGHVLFPDHRLVGFCGLSGSPALGRLGVGDLDARVRELERLGVAYAVGRPVLPVLELIAVVVQPFAGRDGRYRVRIDQAVVRTYLDAARRHRALLLLNVQPGRARFIDEVRALEPWLREPDVGLALDPEWAVRSGQVPGRVFGRTTGREIDEVARYLAALVAAGSLPEKVLVVHQLALRIIDDLSTLRRHPGVAVVKSVDGIGPPSAKLETWQQLMRELPAGMRPGFKLFFDEDSKGRSRLMTPSEVLALRPTPDYVMYE